MTTDPRGPKSPGSSVDELLAHERAIPEQSEAVKERLISRAHAAVRLGPPAPTALGPASSLAGRGALTAALAVAVAGAITAAFLLRGSEPASPQRVPPAVAPSAMPPPAPSASEPVAAPSAVNESPATEAFPVPSARAVSPSRPAPGGVEELTLLSRARQADARGDAAGVLALVAEHERAFPGGRLVEEREVLRVKALVTLGRAEQARRAGVKFRRQFPRSVLRPKIDEMLGSLP